MGTAVRGCVTGDCNLPAVPGLPSHNRGWHFCRELQSRFSMASEPTYRSRGPTLPTSLARLGQS